MTSTCRRPRSWARKRKSRSMPCASLWIMPCKSIRASSANRPLAIFSFSRAAPEDEWTPFGFSPVTGIGEASTMPALSRIFGALICFFLRSRSYPRIREVLHPSRHGACCFCHLAPEDTLSLSSLRSVLHGRNRAAADCRGMRR